MFVQVIQGRTNDPAAFRQHSKRWAAELRPGAAGFLGGTTGVTDDGRFVIVVRFADEAAAKANAARPEQTAFWQDGQKLIDGEPRFRETSDTSLLFDGGSDKAGFVQVMEGKVADRAKAESMETPELLAQLRTARPDLLGGVTAWFDGGEYVQVAYFTSEADARKGESNDEFSEQQQEFGAAWGEMTFTDLKDPILTS
jgi:hypothetical protein